MQMLQSDQTNIRIIIRCAKLLIYGMRNTLSVSELCIIGSVSHMWLTVSCNYCRHTHTYFTVYRRIIIYVSSYNNLFVRK